MSFSSGALRSKPPERSDFLSGVSGLPDIEVSKRMPPEVPNVGGGASRLIDSPWSERSLSSAWEQRARTSP